MLGILNRIIISIKRNLKWNSLVFMMALATTVIAVTAVLAITTAMNNRYDEAIDETTKENNTQIVENVGTSIDGYLDEMVAVSDSLSDLLKKSGGDSENMMKNYHFILRNDTNTIAAFDENAKLLLKTDQKMFKNNVSVASQDWFRSVAPGSRNYSISEPHVQSLYQNEYPWVLSLSKGFTWNEAGRTRSGVILVDMNFKNIEKLCSKELGQNGYIFILGSGNELIYHPNQQMIYYGIPDKAIPQTVSLGEGNSVIEVNNTRMSVSVKRLKNTDWRIVGISKLNGLFTYQGEIKNFIALIMIAVVLLILILSIYVSFLIDRPIRRLIKLMGEVEEGKLDTFSPANGAYEVQELSNSFNNMIHKIKQLMAEVVGEQQQLRKSEMKALHAQINPHFLYNTLDSIVWMAESGDNKNVVKMISALAMFFRLSLSGGKDTITVEEELKHAENYLIIQKMRYSDQFDYEMIAEDDVIQCKTLKIVLQPIIENAIIHGVANLPYHGKIIIRAEHSGDKMLFQVSDNGFGILPEKLSNILEADPQNKSGIGIKNVNRRIQLLFGNEYGLQYESELDEGTTVTIRLPYVK